MNTNEFIELLKEELEIESEINVETHLDQIQELDSMGRMVLIALTDEKFRKKITAADIKNCSTIFDLAKFLNVE